MFGSSSTAKTPTIPIELEVETMKGDLVQPLSKEKLIFEAPYDQALAAVLASNSTNSANSSAQTQGGSAGFNSSVSISNPAGSSSSGGINQQSASFLNRDSSVVVSSASVNTGNVSGFDFSPAKSAAVLSGKQSAVSPANPFSAATGNTLTPVVNAPFVAVSSAGSVSGLSNSSASGFNTISSGSDSLNIFSTAKTVGSPFENKTILTKEGLMSEKNANGAPLESKPFFPKPSNTFSPLGLNENSSAKSIVGSLSDNKSFNSVGTVISSGAQSFNQMSSRPIEMSGNQLNGLIALKSNQNKIPLPGARENNVAGSLNLNASFGANPSSTRPVSTYNPVNQSQVNLGGGPSKPLLALAIILFLLTMGGGGYYYFFIFKKAQEEAAAYSEAEKQADQAEIPDVTKIDQINSEQNTDNVPSSIQVQFLQTPVISSKVPRVVLVAEKILKAKLDTIKFDFRDFFLKNKEQVDQDGGTLFEVALDGQDSIFSLFNGLEMNFSNLTEDLDNRAWFFAAYEKPNKEDLRLSLIILLKENSNGINLNQKVLGLENTLPNQSKNLFLIAGKNVILPNQVNFKQSSVDSRIRFFNFSAGKTEKSVDWGIIESKGANYLILSTSKRSTELILKRMLLGPAVAKESDAMANNSVVQSTAIKSPASGRN